MCSHFLCQAISKELLKRTSCTTTPAWPIQRNHYYDYANKYIGAYFQVFIPSRYQYSMYSCCCAVLHTRCTPAAVLSSTTHANVPNFCRPIKYQDKHDRLSKSTRPLHFICSRKMYGCSYLLNYFSSASCRTLQDPSRENNYCLLYLFSVRQDPSLHNAN